MNDTISNSSDAAVTRPRRPTLDDLAVRLAVPRVQWARVQDWLVDDGMSISEIEDERERIIREIADALEHGESGYHVCRTLDRAGWSPDDGLVEIMGHVLHARHHVLRVIEEEWVAANDVRPTHVVGDVVQIAKHPGRFDRSSVQGEIIEVDTARGRYLVFSSALGHVRKADTTGHVRGTLGRYVAFEDVLPPSPPEAPEVEP